jgi:hypothetical protein
VGTCHNKELRASALREQFPQQRGEPEA